MRSLLPILLLVFVCSCIAQDNQREGQLTFFALVVSDIDASIEWYSRTLEFDVVNTNIAEEMQFRHANLKYGNVLLELIELGSSLDPAEAIEGFTPKTYLQGLFKVGFAVSDLETRVAGWKEAGIAMKGDIVRDPVTKRQMIILLDPDGNRIQLFER